MNRALITLIRLSSKAALRRTLRGARTVPGALLLLFTIGLLALMIVPQVVSAIMMNGRPEMRQFSGAAATIAPLALLAFTLLSIFSSAGEAAVFFTPAEIDFLFAAPFSRRELLVYKLAKAGQALVIVSGFLALMMQMSLRSLLAGFVGLFLTLTMIQLVSMAVALAGQIVTESAYTRTRRFVLLATAVVLMFGLADLLGRAGGRGIDEILNGLRTSPIFAVVLAPFRVFTGAIFAETVFPELLGWGAGALAIDAALLLLVLRLDADYIESAATISQKVYERILRAKQGGGFAMVVGPKAARRSLPPLPWLGGAGPVGWRQGLIVMRTSRHVLIVAAAMLGIAVVAGFAFSSGGGRPATAFAPMALGLIVYMTFILAMQLPWAFRGDIDHIDFLKSLPVRSAALVAGEMAGGVVLLTAVQVVLFGLVTAASPESWPMTLAAAAFAGPFNALQMTINNLLFLLYPVRHQGGTSVDFQIMGKMSLFMFFQLALMAPLLGIPTALGAAAFFLAGSSWWAFGFTTWLLLAVELVPLVICVAWAFRRFDVSTHTPA